ncbi:MAG: ABC transporter substrate-binding protein, partial [Actinomycetota bacterium]|nr:ABC transporter substrate-binding protein [Actinomycetota bacterium]
GFQTTGQLTVVPNPRYSGPNKPKVAEFKELPFTSTSSEFDALRSGTIDYGYLPSTDLGQVHSLESHGYKIVPSYASSLTYITINYSNPKYGHLVGQLYIRQAMQMLINEPEYVKTVLGGYGVLTYGPSYAPRAQPSSKSKGVHPPYPYDPAKAEHLLRSHGWSVPSHGVATCVKPGSGAHRCGQGIADHTALDIPLTYASGIPMLAEEAQAMQSSFGAAGIKLLLKEEPSTTVIDDSYDCHDKPMAKCSAHSPTLSYWSSPSYSYGPTYFPGTTLFVCHDSTNDGNYCNSKVTSLARKLLVESTSAAASTLRHLDRYLARQLPDLWMPSAPAEIAAISTKLAGAYAEGVNEYFYPQTWSLKP